MFDRAGRAVVLAALQRHCAHRGCSLYYGFLENGGLRCAYHGWLWHKSGKCLEQPFEPAESMMKHVVRQAAALSHKQTRALTTEIGKVPGYRVLNDGPVFDEVTIACPTDGATIRRLA